MYNKGEEPEPEVVESEPEFANDKTGVEGAEKKRGDVVEMGE